MTSDSNRPFTHTTLIHVTHPAGILRATACALVIAAVDPAALMAQSATASTVERFDLSGVAPRGVTEQSLRDRVARHHAGDMSDAIAIQRALAAYYLTHGDTLRANAAAALRDGGKPAGAMARYGDVPAKTYGEVPAKKYGDVPAKTYGELPAKTYGDVPAPRYDAPASSAAPTTRGTTGRDPAPVRERASTAPTPPGASPSGAQDMHFFHMADPAHEDLWDFKADGSFSHTEVGGQGGVSARTSETGTYAIANGTLVVNVTQRIGAAAVTGSGQRNTLTADQSATSETRKYTISLLGVRGASGMLLNGVRYYVKNW